MNQNSYIAILFAMIFFGKILAVDSTILLAIFDTNEIAYANPYCKKQLENIDGSHSNKALAEDSKRVILTLDSFCNTPFGFESFLWEYNIIIEESQTHVYRTPAMPDFFQNKIFLPPQIELLPQFI